MNIGHADLPSLIIPGAVIGNEFWEETRVWIKVIEGGPPGFHELADLLLPDLLSHSISQPFLVTDHFKFNYYNFL